MKKKFTVFLVGTLLMLGMPNILMANEIRLVINGAAINDGARPVQEQGSTLVPLRVVSTNLGANVNYESSTKCITINKGNTHIKLQIGSVQATINDKQTTMVMAPKIINGITYVPIRFVSENLECNVDWKSDTRVVEITEKTNNEISNVVDEIINNNQESTIENEKQLEMEYSNFKKMFSVEKKEVTVNNEILYDVKYTGTLSKNDFWDKWKSIDQKDDFGKRMGREIREKNPTYTVALYFKYKSTDLGYVFAYPANEYFSNGYELNSFTINPFNIHNIN